MTEYRGNRAATRLRSRNADLARIVAISERMGIRPGSARELFLRLGVPSASLRKTPRDCSGPVGVSANNPVFSTTVFGTHIADHRRWWGPLATCHAMIVVVATAPSISQGQTISEPSASDHSAPLY